MQVGQWVANGGPHRNRYPVWLTVRQAAELLDCEATTICLLIADGHLPRVEDGSRVLRIRRDAVHRLMGNLLDDGIRRLLTGDGDRARPWHGPRVECRRNDG